METDVDRIHRASMEILSEVGIALHHPEIIALAGQHGFRVDGDLVYFTETALMDLVSQAPEMFTYYADNPQYTARVGEGSLLCAPGQGAPNIINDNNTSRRGSFEDYLQFLKLTEASDALQCNGGIIIHPSEIDQSRSSLIMLQTLLEHSQKCRIMPVGSADELEVAQECFDFWYDGKFAEAVHISGFVSTLSPLQLDGHALQFLIFLARNGQAPMISPCAMAGTTGPVTFAGNLALSNAEVLAGIACAQMIRPGTPIVYGMVSTCADMRTGGISIGCPERALYIQYAGELARYYGVPLRTGGAENDAHGVNAQASAESTLNMFATFSAGADIVIHSAGILAGFAAMSFEKFIMDIEIISMLQVYRQGAVFDDAHLALDIIKEVGIGGSFLTHKHTMLNCREAMWQPHIGTRRAIKDAVDHQQELSKKLEKEKNRLLGEYNKPDIDPGKLSIMRKILTG